jgi:hypothetical protein
VVECIALVTGSVPPKVGVSTRKRIGSQRSSIVDGRSRAHAIRVGSLGVPQGIRRMLDPSVSAIFEKVVQGCSLIIAGRVARVDEFLVVVPGKIVLGTICEKPLRSI